MTLGQRCASGRSLIICTTEQNEGMLSHKMFENSLLTYQKHIQYGENMSRQGVGYRLAKAAYFLGIVVSCGFLVLAVPGFVGTFEEMFLGISYLFWKPQLELLLYVVGAISAYAAGWALRWIATGETSSIIDRFLRK